MFYRNSFDFAGGGARVVAEARMASGHRYRAFGSRDRLARVRHDKACLGNKTWER